MNWLLLLLVYQIKHFLADFPLQTPYMLQKFKASGWVKPLAAHCAVHGFFTALICSFVNPALMVPLALLDMAIHFVMDRIKASPKMLGRYESLSKDQFKGLLESRALAASGVDYVICPDLVGESKRLVAEIDKKFKGNKYFWWSLGLDQMVHHITHYLIIFILLKN